MLKVIHIHVSLKKQVNIYKALNFDGLYTDSVTGWSSKNVIVVDKIKTESFDSNFKKEKGKRNKG